MIKTGLPYSKDIIAEVYENGAEVDLSVLRFPDLKTVEDEMHAVFVYLRNTGYKVTFNFDNMTYCQKEALLKEYLATKIDYNIPALNTTWLSILYACLGERIKGMESILSDEELIQFQRENFQQVLKIWEFLVSLPLFLIKRLDLDNFDSTAEKTEEEPNLVNFYHVLECEEIDDLIVKGSGDIAPKDYVKLFTVDNTRLFETMADCSFATFLQGIASAEDNDFKEFVKELATKVDTSKV